LCRTTCSTCAHSSVDLIVLGEFPTSSDIDSCIDTDLIYSIIEGTEGVDTATNQATRLNLSSHLSIVLHQLVNFLALKGGGKHRAQK
jgi:hypothetical protein